MCLQCLVCLTFMLVVFLGQEEKELDAKKEKSSGAHMGPVVLPYTTIKGIWGFTAHFLGRKT